MNKLLVRLLRAFFHLLYHPFAWTYDAVAAVVSIGMWHDWVASVLPYLHGPRLLELGFGPGHLQVKLARSGIAAFGLDASPQMTRLARRRLRRAGFAPRLVNGYAQATPFPAHAFAQIVATFPSEYIVHPETLAEIRRLLTPKGELILLPLAWITGEGLLHRLAAGLFRLTGQAPRWNASFLQPLIAAGFQCQVEEVIGHGWKLVIIRAQRVW